MTLQNPKYFYNALLLGTFITIADLLSKDMVFAALGKTTVVNVTSFFNVVKVWNRGISFGMLNNLPNPQLILTALASLICIFLLVWLVKSTKLSVSLALGAIIGGAMGNVIDRLMHGYVADFLDFHIAGLHWPAFNLADSAITIGVLVLLNDEIFSKNKAAENNES
jgi:signal peptidase II